MADATLDFLVGETVHLRARVSKAGSRVPYSPQTVRLTSLRLAGADVALPAIVDFTKVAEGDFTLVIDSSPLAPGTYDVVVTLSDGPNAVRLLRGTFVLNPVTA